MRTKTFVSLSKWKTPTEETLCRGNKAAGFQIKLVLLLLVVPAPLAPAAAHYEALLLLGEVGNAINVTGPSLCCASDGVLYGTTDTGTNLGTVFKLNRDGTGYRVLYNFTGGNSDGARPEMGVIEGSDGALYGTTGIGGTFNLGTLFKVNKDGSGYRVLHHFAGSPNDGSGPGTAPGAEDQLLEGTDGAIYGITTQGGSIGVGTAFRINHDGSGYGVLYNFGQPTADGFHDYGSYPTGGLIEATNGVLYGTASNGGLGETKGGEGVVFSMNRDGSAYTILHNFSKQSGDAFLPEATLMEASDGALYGTSAGYGNGSDPSGAIFTIHKDGNGYAIIHTFPPGNGTESDSHRLLEASDGFLYGTTQRGGTNQMGLIYMIRKDGSGYTILHTFPGEPTDGLFPGAGLVRGSDSVFYGMTPKGGSGSLGISDGLIYKLWPPETPDMLSSIPVVNGVQVTLAGMATNQYRLFRSTDLSHWSVLTNIMMPPPATYTHLDSSPFASPVFYRAAWVP